MQSRRDRYLAPPVARLHCLHMESVGDEGVEGRTRQDGTTSQADKHQTPGRRSLCLITHLAHSRKITIWTTMRAGQLQSRGQGVKGVADILVAPFLPDRTQKQPRPRSRHSHVTTWPSSEAWPLESKDLQTPAPSSLGSTCLTCRLITPGEQSAQSAPHSHNHLHQHHQGLVEAMI